MRRLDVSRIDLGGVRISLSAPLPDEYLLMVLGGRAPAPKWFAALVRTIAADVWAVDSGADACKASGVRPCVLIGDGDSASPDAREWATRGGAVEKKYSSDKDFTDFQLALDCWREDPSAKDKTPIVTGCFGGRLDHLFSNLHSFSMVKSKAKKRMSRCMIDDNEGVFLLYSAEEAEFVFEEAPLAVSLLPLSNRCAGVSIEGVRWPLERVVLERRLPWAISNEVSGACDGTAKFTAGCGRGILGVYWCGKRGK